MMNCQWTYKIDKFFKRQSHKLGPEQQLGVSSVKWQWCGPSWKNKHHVQRDWEVLFICSQQNEVLLHKILDSSHSLHITFCHFRVWHIGLKTIIVSEIIKLSHSLCHWAGIGVWQDFLLPHFPHLHPAISYCYKRMHSQTSWCHRIRMNISVENWFDFFLVEMYSMHWMMKLLCACQARISRQCFSGSYIDSLSVARKTLPLERRL